MGAILINTCSLLVLGNVKKQKSAKSKTSDLQVKKYIYIFIKLSSIIKYIYVKL